jgi:type IV pilus assembly protein PilC
MSNFSYVAVDPRGLETRGSLEVADQSEALRRIREMGLFPTKVFGARNRARMAKAPPRRGLDRVNISINIPGLSGRVKPRALTIFTRQLATLVEAGMPLVRGLRTLREQEGNPTLKRIIEDLSQTIENGSSFAEAVAAHPKVFNRLYVNMVKAGELGGALETTLRRLAEFMEKALRIKGKIKAAMFYPCAVLFVATGILVLLLAYIVPKFQLVFADMMGNRPLPTFTMLVLKLSEAVRGHLAITLSVVAALAVALTLGLRTQWGRWTFDRFKLAMPLLGPVFKKAAISRFARTLGTLVGSGVPILQALTIVKETAGNVVVGGVVSAVHGQVKEGETIAPTLKASGVFPAMVAGMVDVGEQTGALPEMLMKIADNCDEDVDNAASAMTSLLEPIMIIFLAVVVGSIVIAMFLPIISAIDGGFDNGERKGLDWRRASGWGAACTPSSGTRVRCRLSSGPNSFMGRRTRFGKSSAPRTSPLTACPNGIGGCSGASWWRRPTSARSWSRSWSASTPPPRTRTCSRSSSRPGAWNPGSSAWSRNTWRASTPPPPTA